MAHATILIVDDEADIIELVCLTLAREHYRILTATTGEQALQIIRNNRPDLVVLDLILPGIDGLEVCRRLKSNAATRQIPVMMLTAKTKESDIVTGLELGAEDYVTKPFSPKILLARIRNILRHRMKSETLTKPIRIEDITIDPGKRQVHVKNKPIPLTCTEFNILSTLANKPGMVFSRPKIVQLTRGNDYLVNERVIDVQITSLRKKLGPCGKYIQTVRGVGYRIYDHPLQK